jgi:tetratricopeptide (TPR) repeat protein
MDIDSTRLERRKGFANTFLNNLASPFQYLFRKSRHISPVLLGMAVFALIYLNKCNNDGNLDGIDYFNQGEYAKAIKSYDEFLLLNPHDVKTLYNRGRCYEVMGNDDKAEMDYDRVLELEPYHANALLGLSQVFYRKEDYVTAINLAESAATTEPENYMAHYYAGRAYHKIEYWLDALKCYNAVIELNPDYGYAYFHRSSVMLSLGLRPMGCHDLKAAVALNVEGAEEALQKYCSD